MPSGCSAAAATSCSSHWPAVLAVVGVLAGLFVITLGVTGLASSGTLGIQPLHAPLPPPPDPAASLAGRVTDRPATAHVRPGPAASRARAMHMIAGHVHHPARHRARRSPRRLAGLLDGPYASVRQQLREIICRDEFAPVIALPTAGVPRARDGVDADDRRRGPDRAGLPAALRRRTAIPAPTWPRLRRSASATSRCWSSSGCSSGCGAVPSQQLGTERHHERYLRKIASLELPGCFAMTEAGHGSDVQNLQTTATYDPDAQEFVIDTPSDCRPQGVHRQRRLPRAHGGRVRAADRRRREPRRARLRGRHPRRAGPRPRWGPDRGLRREDGPQRGRQRAHLVRRTARRRARRCSTATAT